MSRRTATIILAIAVVAGPLAVPAKALFTRTRSLGSNTFATVAIAPPTNLSVSGSCETVFLNWNPSATTQADGYDIQRSSRTGMATISYQLVAHVSGRTTSSYIDGSATVGSTYFYRVGATLLTWKSEWSNEDYITPTVSTGSTCSVNG